MAGPGVLETLNLRLLAGEGFREGIRSEGFDFMLNETAARRLGWSPQKAIGQRLESHGRTGQVVGVVQDFHSASLHEAIGPLMFFSDPSELGYVLAKIAPGNPAPIAYVVMSRWLEGFAFHAGLSWWIFAAAGTVALTLALLTVSSHALRAALANPVESLRSE